MRSGGGGGSCKNLLGVVELTKGFEGGGGRGGEKGCRIR